MEYDVGIDKYNLDEESIYVPAAYDVFSQKEAEESQRLDALRDKMKILQADVEIEIRGWTTEQLSAYYNRRIDKVTEQVYKSLVLIHPEVIDLYQEIEQCRHSFRIYEAARRGVERKAEGLDRLARLHGSGYYMKIEGRPYRKLGIDATIDKAKSVIMRRSTGPAAPSYNTSPEEPINKAHNEMFGGLPPLFPQYQNQPQEQAANPVHRVIQRTGMNQGKTLKTPKQ